LPSSVIFARVIVMLLARKGLSTLWCKLVTAVIQASSAAVSGVAVGAGVLAAVLRAGAGAGAAWWPAHPPTASKTAAPSPATAGLPPPRLMIAKNRPDEYGDGSIVPPYNLVPAQRRAGQETRHCARDGLFTQTLPKAAPVKPLYDAHLAPRMIGSPAQPRAMLCPVG